MTKRVVLAIAGFATGFVVGSLAATHAAERQQAHRYDLGHSPAWSFAHSIERGDRY